MVFYDGGNELGNYISNDMYLDVKIEFVGA